jgi:hypothetical protein
MKRATIKWQSFLGHDDKTHFYAQWDRGTPHTRCTPQHKPSVHVTVELMLLHGKMCETATAFSNGRGVTCTYLPNVGITSASASTFGLISLGISPWVLIFYFTSWILSYNISCWKVLYSGCLNMCHELLGRGCSRKSEFRDSKEMISRMSRTDGMGSSVTVFNSNGFFVHMQITWDRTITQSLAGLSTISLQIFGLLSRRSNGSVK